MYTLCENVTSNKDIISVATHNKLCQTGALQAQRKGGVQKCVTENDEAECTATITAQQSIGDEYRWATDCVEELLEDNITVKYQNTKIKLIPAIQVKIWLNIDLKQNHGGHLENGHFQQIAQGRFW